MKKMVSISIVTVVFNDVENIQRTIKSVLDQRLEGFTIQYIVIDGGSTDGTVDRIKPYLSKIDYFVTEPDRGIYDAMNKGIKMATGDWVVFLNSGDSLISKFSLRDTVSSGLCSDVDLFATKVVYGAGKIFHPCQWSISLKNNIHHQGVLYNRNVFKERGFSTGYSILADYEFNYWLFNKGASISTIDIILTECNEGGVSQVPKWINYKEEIAIRRRYKGNFLYHGFSIFRYVMKSISFIGK